MYGRCRKTIDPCIYVLPRESDLACVRRRTVLVNGQYQSVVTTSVLLRQTGRASRKRSEIESKTSVAH